MNFNYTTADLPQEVFPVIIHKGLKEACFMSQTRLLCAANKALLCGKEALFGFYSCPASTCLTMRSVKRSTPSGSYFLVRLAPKSAAKAW